MPVSAELGLLPEAAALRPRIWIGGRAAARAQFRDAARRPAAPGGPVTFLWRSPSNVIVRTVGVPVAGKVGQVDGGYVPPVTGTWGLRVDDGSDSPVLDWMLFEVTAEPEGGAIPQQALWLAGDGTAVVSTQGMHLAAVTIAELPVQDHVAADDTLPVISALGESKRVTGQALLDAADAAGALAGRAALLDHTHPTQAIQGLDAALAGLASVAARVEAGLAGEDLSRAMLRAPGATLARSFADRAADQRRSVRDLGVKGDVRRLTAPCTIAAGGTVLTVQGAGFRAPAGQDPGDKGKVLILDDAARFTQPVPLLATIQEVLGPRSVRLSRTAGLGFSNSSISLRYGALDTLQRACSITAYAKRLTVDQPTFAAADYGKTLIIPGAGVFGGPFATTISKVVSATVVEVAQRCQTTLEGVSTPIQLGFAVTASATASLALGASTLSVTADRFSAADVGKTIWVSTGDAASFATQHAATIAQVLGPDQVQLSAAAYYGLAGVPKTLVFGTDDTLLLNAAVNSPVPVDIPPGDYLYTGELAVLGGAANVRCVGRPTFHVTRTSSVLRLSAPGAQFFGGCVLRPIQRGTAYAVVLDATARLARLGGLEIERGNSGVQNSAPGALIEDLHQREMLGSAFKHLGPSASGSVVSGMRLRNITLGGMQHEDGAEDCLLLDGRHWNDETTMTPIQRLQWLQWNRHLGGDIWSNTQECRRNRAVLVYRINARDGNLTCSGDENSIIGGLTVGSLSSGVGCGGSYNSFHHIRSVGNKHGFYVFASAGGLGKSNLFVDCHSVDAREYGFRSDAILTRQWIMGRTYTAGARFCWYGRNVYKLAQPGVAYTFGGTPPTHTAGTVSDGLNLWLWISGDADTLDSDRLKAIGCSARGSGLVDWGNVGEGSWTRIGCFGASAEVDEVPPWDGTASRPPADLATYFSVRPGSIHASHRGVRGVQSWANRRLAVPGDVQASRWLLHASTRVAEPTVATTDGRPYGPRNTMVLPDAALYVQRGRWLAHDVISGQVKVWDVARAVVRRGAGAASTTVALSQAVVFADPGTEAWTVELEADTTLGAGQWVVTGGDGDDIAWQGDLAVQEIVAPPIGGAGSGLLVDYDALGPEAIFRRGSRAYDLRHGPLGLADTDQPRLPHLLLEETRTNGVTNPGLRGGVVGTPGTLPSGLVKTGTWPAEITTSVTSIGAYGDALYVDIHIQGTPSTAPGNAELRWMPNTQAPAAVAGEAWTSSAYLQLALGSLANLGIGHFLEERTATGGTVAGLPTTLVPVRLDPVDPAAIDGGVSALPDGRVEVTRTLTGATTGRATAGLRFAWTVGGAVDATLRLWITQLERGPYASSPILPPAGGTGSTTRSIDTLRAAAASLFPAGAGTVVFKIMVPRAAPATNSLPVVQLDSSTDTDRLRLRVLAGGTALVPGLTVAGVTTDLPALGTIVPGEEALGVLTWDGTGVSGLLAGGAVVSQALAVPLGQTFLRVGTTVGGAALGGEVRYLRAIAGRTADAGLQALLDAVPPTPAIVDEEPEEPGEDEEEEGL